LNRGKRPKLIALDQCSESTGSIEFKKRRKAIADLSQRLKKKEESLLGMKYLDDVKNFIDTNIITTKTEFDCRGNTLLSQTNLK
jgi:hypothetical protein